MRKLIDQVSANPWVLDAGLKISDMFSFSTPYDTSWRHIRRWQKELLNISVTPVSQPRRLLFLCYYYQWVDYSFPIALVLASLGHKVDFAWRGEYRTGLQSKRPRSFDHWLLLARKESSKFQDTNMRLIDLDQVVPSEVDSIMREDAETQARMDTSYVRTKERIDLVNDPSDMAAFEFRRDANIHALAQLNTLLAENAYDRVILASGGILEFGASFLHMKRRRMEVMTYECSDTANAVWLSSDDPVTCLNTAKLWEADAPHVLTPERKRRVDTITARRRTPKSESLVQTIQISDVAPAKAIYEEFGLDPKKPTVLMCPNVPFDAIFANKPGMVFKGMWDWLGQTAVHLSARSDVNVIIRCHPAEQLFIGEIESAQSILMDYLPIVPAHFRVLEPKHPVSTFSLMDIADLGLTYASTTGLEMAVAGVPVVVGNPNHHYNGKGFTRAPVNLDEYFAAIDKVLADPAANRLSAREVELAYCYTDIYYNKWAKPFPWTMSRMARDFKEWPPCRVMSDEGMQRFSKTFEELSA